MECASAVVGDLARPQNMAAALADADAVIHSAGVAHAMSGLPEDDYRVLNTEATIALARAAQRAGVKRFIFLSSIRAQSGPTAEHVLTEDLAPQPTEAYGRSKLAAEQGLAELDLDWVALRLVLVYGAGVKGNMAELVRFARAPYPLPLGALRGRRSLLALDNLVAAIDTVLAAPGRLRRPFLVADPAALTIPEMITALCRRPCSKWRCARQGGRRSTNASPARWWRTPPRSFGSAGRRRPPRRMRSQRSRAADVHSYRRQLSSTRHARA